MESSGNSGLISVIIPCLNAEKWIKQAVQSAAADDVVAEVIVVDNGSTDRTAVVAAGCGSKVRVLHCSRRGASCARNVGLVHARSQFVHFMDGDDYVEPGFFSQVRAELDTTTDLVIVGHRHISEDGATIREVTYGPMIDHKAVIAEYLSRAVQTGGLIWRKDWLPGAWDERLSIYQDAEFTLRMLLNGPKVTVIQSPKSLAVWREHKDGGRISNSFSKPKAASSLAALNRHKPSLQMLGDDRIIGALALRFYDLARRCYVARHYREGNAALASARELGLHGNPGSWTHAIACRILGVRLACEFKVRLRGILNQLCSLRLGQRRRYKVSFATKAA